MKKFVVYAIIDKRTNEFKYVGQTTMKLSLRLVNHICSPKNENKKLTPINAWAVEMIENGMRDKIGIIEIDSAKNKKELNEREAHHIRANKSTVLNRMIPQQFDKVKDVREKKKCQMPEPA